ncbi:MAG: FHA domain-containing protein [Holophagaceae bacterium]|nr:FHA domain-containing protein [Holophagaceae bacterium]
MAQRYALRIQDRNGFERKAPLGNVAVLGRQQQCDVVLSDEMVSRVHLRVECNGGQYWAEDMGSSHGTFKDGVKIGRIKWEPTAVLVIADGAYRLSLVPERVGASESNMYAILSTAQQLAGEFDLKPLLQVSIDHLLRLSGQDRGMILIEDNGKLDVFVQRNVIPDSGEDRNFSMSSANNVFYTGEAIWISDISTNEALKTHQSIVDMQIKTIICMPLSVRGKNIGVVYLDSNHTMEESIDRSAFEAIVELCALAIQRTRLFEEDQRIYIQASVGAMEPTLAHEFNSIVSEIEGHAELISRLGADPEMQYHVGQIKTAVGHLSELSSKIIGLGGVKDTENIASELMSIIQTASISDTENETLHGHRSVVPT